MQHHTGAVSGLRVAAAVGNTIEQAALLSHFFSAPLLAGIGARSVCLDAVDAGLSLLPKPLRTSMFGGAVGLAGAGWAAGFAAGAGGAAFSAIALSLICPSLHDLN